ncbi:MAG: hypothetical protein V7742_04260 [Halioglobus sp.]
MTIRIAMWSGPRNISTAMMRSWENRPDTQVVDEPFYAYYLDQTQSPHPGFEEVMASQSRDYQQVACELTEGECHSTIEYQKHMTHHMLDGVDLCWTAPLKHCFLIRDPAQVVASYTNSRGVCSVEDIGIIRQAELYEKISEISGQDIPVLDSNDVQNSPEEILGKLCDRFELPFSDSMLNWPSGPRDSDGVWAKHWYRNVERSTGFKPYVPKVVALDDIQLEVVNQVQPYYDRLYKIRIS